MAAVTFTTAGSIANDFFEHCVDLKEIEIPLYLETSRNSHEAQFEIAGIIQIKTIGKSFQRRGFFRIGVMPMLVLDGLTIEILDNRHIDEALVKANEKLRTHIKSTAAIEGRDFTVTFSNGRNAVVKARIVRFLSKEAWTLEDGTVDVGGNSECFKIAVMRVAGGRAGEMIFQNNNHETQLNLAEFGRKPTPPKQ